jgi:hypothetical protein
MAGFPNRQSESDIESLERDWATQQKLLYPDDRPMQACHELAQAHELPVPPKLRQWFDALDKRLESVYLSKHRLLSHSLHLALESDPV